MPHLNGRVGSYSADQPPSSGSCQHSADIMTSGHVSFLCSGLPWHGVAWSTVSVHPGAATCRSRTSVPCVGPSSKRLVVMGLVPVDGFEDEMPSVNESAKNVQELAREQSELNTRIEDVTARWEDATGQDRAVLGSMLIHLNGLAAQVRQDLQVCRGKLLSPKHLPLKGSWAPPSISLFFLFLYRRLSC